MSRKNCAKEKQWLLNNFHNYINFKELTKAYNLAFNTNSSISSTRTRCSRLNLHFNPFRYTEEMYIYLKEIRSKYTAEECVNLFNKKFNTNKTKDAINTYCLNNNIYTGRDGRYKKGHVPFSKGLKGKEFLKYLPENSLKNMQRTQFKRVHKINKVFLYRGDPYINTIGGDVKNYQQYSKYMYEKLYGIKLNKQDAIIFLDGNPNNYEKDNMYLVNKYSKMYINRKLKHPNKDLTIALNEIWKIEKLIKEMEGE